MRAVYSGVQLYTLCHAMDIVLEWKSSSAKPNGSFHVIHNDDANDDTEYIMRMSRENIHAIFYTEKKMYISVNTHTHSATTRLLWLIETAIHLNE